MSTTKINGYIDAYEQLLTNIFDFGFPTPNSRYPCKTLYNEQMVLWEKAWNAPYDLLRYASLNAYWEETKWDIAGKTNVNDLGFASFLWQPWAQRNGDLQNSYGASLRNFANQGIDQLENAIITLKESPYTRRAAILMMDPTRPPVTTDLGVNQVPPCHPLVTIHNCPDYGLIMTVTARSQDAVVGLPGDVVRYYWMLHLIGRATNIPAAQLVFNFTNVHIYKVHMEEIMGLLEGNITPFEEDFQTPDDPFHTVQNITSIEDMLTIKFSQLDVGNYPRKKKSIMEGYHPPYVRFQPLV